MTKQDRRHRINETTISSVSSTRAFITQRDPLDDKRNHMVYLTVEELRALLAAVEAS